MFSVFFRGFTCPFFKGFCKQAGRIITAGVGYPCYGVERVLEQKKGIFDPDMGDIILGIHTRISAEFPQKDWFAYKT